MELKTLYYVVERIDGDYACLRREGGQDRLVALALLPADLEVGMRLKYELFQYSVVS